jgi:hypothetical protein
MINDAIQHHAAMVAQERYDYLRKRFHKKPDPVAVVVAAQVWAEQVEADVRFHESDPRRFLTPLSRPCGLCGVARVIAQPQKRTT